MCSPKTDRGFTKIVRPMICTNCKSLKNVVVANYTHDSDEPVPVEHVRCDTCERSDELLDWDGKQCPSCDPVQMKRSGAIMMWD